MSKQQDRTTVRTYVPEHQYEIWRESAEAMDMSLSEFVRSMVQAGRRDFEMEGSREGESSAGVEPHSDPSNPGGHGLEDRVLSTLDSAGVADWSELVDELSGDFEARLEDVIGELEDRGEIRYAPREGGYVRRGDD